MTKDIDADKLYNGGYEDGRKDLAKEISEKLDCMLNYEYQFCIELNKMLTEILK